MSACFGAAGHDEVCARLLGTKCLIDVADLHGDRYVGLGESIDMRGEVPEADRDQAGAQVQHRCELGVILVQCPRHQPYPVGPLTPPVGQVGARRAGGNGRLLTDPRPRTGRTDTDHAERAPAETAAASRPSPGPAIGAPMMGMVKSNESVNQVRTI